MRTIIILALSMFAAVAFSQQLIYLRNISDSLEIGKLKLKSGIRISLDSNRYGHEYRNRRIVSITDSTITSVYLNYSSGKELYKITHKLKYYDKVFIGYRHNEGFYFIGALSMLGGIGAMVASPIVWAVRDGDEAGDTLLTGGIVLVSGFVLCLPFIFSKSFDLKQWKLISLEEYNRIKILRREIKRSSRKST